MKKIEAVIKPFKLDDVTEALKELGINGMTVADALGYGQQCGTTPIYRGDTYTQDRLPKAYLMIVVPDEMADAVVAVIIKKAKTGKIGDGRIFVSTIEQAIRIRTEETGDRAVT